MEREIMERERKWYIIHTYSGYERKVAESLMNRIQAYDLGECIGQILIPTEDVVEMKSGKKIVLAITNAGGLRKNEIAAGELRASDIFELMPFENALITLDVTGVQLKKLLQIGTRDAQSGAKVEYRWNEQNRTEILSSKLLDANGNLQEINPETVYTIVTIDYLYKLNSGSYAVLQEGKNVTPLNITIRDAVTNYIKAETAAGRHIQSRIDNRYVQIGPGPKQETPPND